MQFVTRPQAIAETESPPSSTLVRVAALAVIWGFSFLLIKIGGAALAPLQIAVGRMVSGAALLVAVLLVRRERLPRGWRIWGHLALAALLLNTIPFSLFGYAEERIPSALAGICNATTPLFTLLMSLVAFGGKPPTRARALGLTVGFAGVMVVLGVWRGLGAHDLAGTLMALGAAFCYGVGLPYLRRHLADSGHSNLALSTGQLLAGSAQLLLLTPLCTHAPTRLPISAGLAVLTLGALGTGLAHLINYSVIRDVGATVASTVTYLIPVVSTLAGVLILGERLRWNEPLGATVILVGAALSGGHLPLLVQRLRS